jgi:hypothetical protein
MFFNGDEMSKTSLWAMSLFKAYNIYTLLVIAKPISLAVVISFLQLTKLRKVSFQQGDCSLRSQ